MSTTRTASAVAAACLTLLTAACGSSPAAKAAKPQSFEQALGIDDASLQAREAKVQEAVRACMKTEGFDYIPTDASNSHMKFAIAGAGNAGSAKDLRTKGYGITTGFGDRPQQSGQADKDPNEAIRNGLSDADKTAYDRALYGSSAVNRGSDDKGGAGFHIQVSAGSAGGKDGPSSTNADDGCFGKAQRDTPGGPQKLGASLHDLQQRIDSDPRLVTANRDWAACMSTSGYSSWETPDKIPDYLIHKMQEVLGAGDGPINIGEQDQAKLGTLRDEELTIAKADADCRDKTGRDATATKVQDEAKERFLAEHPDLTTK